MEAVVVSIKQLWNAVLLLVVTKVPDVGPVLDQKPGHVVIGVAPALGGVGGHIYHLAEVKHQELVQVGVLGAPGCPAVEPSNRGSPAMQRFRFSLSETSNVCISPVIPPGRAKDIGSYEVMIDKGAVEQ